MTYGHVTSCKIGGRSPRHTLVLPKDDTSQQYRNTKTLIACTF
jgi:hypothetical protein